MLNTIKYFQNCRTTREGKPRTRKEVEIVWSRWQEVLLSRWTSSPFSVHTTLGSSCSLYKTRKTWESSNYNAHCVNSESDL